MHKLSKKELKELFLRNKNVSIVEEDSPRIVTNNKSLNLIIWFKKKLNKKAYMRVAEKINLNKNYLNLKKWDKLTYEESILMMALMISKNQNIASISNGLPDENKGSPLIVIYFS